MKNSEQFSDVEYFDKSSTLDFLQSSVNSSDQ